MDLEHFSSSYHANCSNVPSSLTLFLSGNVVFLHVGFLDRLGLLRLQHGRSNGGRGGGHWHGLAGEVCKSCLVLNSNLSTENYHVLTNQKTVRDLILALCGFFSTDGGSSFTFLSTGGGSNFTPLVSALVCKH